MLLYVFICRGKEFGHDVDFILTTLELGKEENLLQSVVRKLKKQVSTVCWFSFF